MPQKCICKVTESRALCGGVRLLTVSAPEIAETARPGQFVHLTCSDGLFLRRPISICSASHGLLTMVVEARGKGSGILTGLTAGDEADVLGPLGNGFTIPSGRILAVGGGIGVPPLLYAVMCAGSADAVLGFRSEDRIILKEEFEAVCGRVAVTTDDGSFGEKGSVAGPVERALDKGGYAAVLACGPRIMLKAVSALCAERGIPCQVSMEERMGCGVGACLVCACKTVENGEEKMRRACKDGPVFNASEVVW